MAMRRRAWLCGGDHTLFSLKNALGQVVKAYRARAWSIGQEAVTLPQPS